MYENIEAFLIHEDDGWHVLLVFPNGAELVSDEAYDDRAECEKVFHAWCLEMDAHITKRHMLH